MSILRILPRLPRFLRIPAAFCILLLPSLSVRAADSPAKPMPQHPVLTGQDAFTDALHESPGIRRHLTVADLPTPAPEQSVDNGPTLVPRPANAWPIAPKGFKVDLYATGLDNPRLIRTAPNGDLFLAESETGKIKVFRGVASDGKASQVSVFATGLHQPFGIAFYPAGSNPKWVYIGDTDGIVRFPYKSGDLTASGPAEHLADLPGGGRLRGGGHWTRDIIFTKDGTKLFASVGSHSNVDDSDTHPEEFHRADVLQFTLKASSSKSTPGVCATASARPSTPSPASSGAPPTKGMASATTFRPTTSPTSRRVASTDGPGSTWGARMAAYKTRATLASTPSCNPRSSPPTSW